MAKIAIAKTNWAGPTLAAKILQHLDEDDNEEPTESALVKAIDEVAAAFGNTRAVCCKYYVHPAIMDAYLHGILTQLFIDQPLRATQTGVGLEEAGVLRLLKRCGTNRTRRRQHNSRSGRGLPCLLGVGFYPISNSQPIAYD